MQYEPLSELRREATDQFVRTLLYASGQRTRAGLSLISTYGIPEKTAAEVADRLAVAGELEVVAGPEGEAFRLTDEGRIAAKARGRYLQEAV